MKTILLFVLFIVPFFSMGQSWFGPDYVEDGHVEEIDTIQRPYQYAPFGSQFTPKGNFHGLLICVNFFGKDGNLPVSNWVTDTLLLPHQQILSSVATTGSPLEYFYSNQAQFAQYYNDSSVKNISKFYQFMSKDSLRFTMDVYKRNGIPWAVTIDPTGVSSWSQMNYKAINQILIEDSLFNWGTYDNRTNRPNYTSSNVLSAADNKPDFIVFVYKYNNSIGSYWVSNGWVSSYFYNSSIKMSGYADCALSTALNFNGYTFDGCGFTFIKGGESMNTMIIHEASHNIFDCPHYGSANRISGSYFFPENGWGTMNVGSGAFYCALGWERWWLDWIDIKSNNQTVNSNVLGDSSLVPTNGEYILHDFITTGDVVRVKIPFSETQTGRSQYLWIENHQGVSIFDYRGWEKDGANPPNIFPSSPRGIVTYIEEIGDNKESPNIFNLGANGIKYLSPTGRFDINYEPASYAQSPNAWGNSIYNFYNFQNANPIAGQFGTQGIMKDYNNNDTIIKSFSDNYGPDPAEEAHSIWKKNNSYTYDFIQHDIAFPINSKIGMSSNPVLINYPKYDTISHVGNYYLNGISFEVMEQYPNGSIKVKISFNDVNITNSIRYCGKIYLPNITNNSNADIIVNSYKTLSIDKSGTPNRITKIDGDFIDYTIFTCLANSKFVQEINSTVDVINKSTLKLENASTYEVKSGSTLNIKSNSHLIMQPGCTLLVRDNATVFIENGSDLQFFGGTITLEGNNSKLEIAGNLDIASNKIFTFNGNGYVKFCSPNSPSENIIAGTGSSIDFVGNGQADVVLEVAQESFYVPSNVVNFNIHNARVYMQHNLARVAVLGSNTAISIDNVKFTPQTANRTSHRGLQVFGQQNCSISNCYFEKGVYGIYGYLTYYGAPLIVNSCVFDNLQYGIWANDKEIQTLSCSFTGCNYGIMAQNMSFSNNKIEDCGFNNNNIGTYYSGGSGANLYVNRTIINSNTNYGIRTIGSFTSTIRCSDIYSNGSYGIWPASANILNMSENYIPQGGKSRIMNNSNYCILLSSAVDIRLDNGYNRITKPSGYKIFGTLTESCGGRIRSLYARNNQWFYPTNGQPVQNTDYYIYKYNCTPQEFYTLSPVLPLSDWSACTGGGTMAMGENTSESESISEAELEEYPDMQENVDYLSSFENYYNELLSGGLSQLNLNEEKDYEAIWEGIKYCFGKIRLQTPSLTSTGSQIFNKTEQGLLRMKQINSNNPKRLFYLELEHATLYRSDENYNTAIHKATDLLEITTDNEEIQEVEYWLCIMQIERDIKQGLIAPQDIDNYTYACDTTGTVKHLMFNNNSVYNSNRINDITLIVIPHPVTTQSVINIELTEKTSATIEIIDNEGKTIKSFNMTEQKTNINVSSNDLPKGIYTVKVTTQNGLIKTTRMIIQ